MEEKRELVVEFDVLDLTEVNCQIGIPSASKSHGH